MDTVFFLLFSKGQYRERGVLRLLAGAITKDYQDQTPMKTDEMGFALLNQHSSPYFL